MLICAVPQNSEKIDENSPIRPRPIKPHVDRSLLLRGKEALFSIETRTMTRDVPCKHDLDCAYRTKMVVFFMLAWFLGNCGEQQRESFNRRKQTGKVNRRACLWVVLLQVFQWERASKWRGLTWPWRVDLLKERQLLRGLH